MSHAQKKFLPLRYIMAYRQSTIGIIPARIGSTRFPRKPLASLGGMPVVEHVYRNATQALDRVVVATDSREIADTVAAFGGEAVMTRPPAPTALPALSLPTGSSVLTMT